MKGMTANIADLENTDNYAILSYSTHSDEWQKDMVTVWFRDYETIPEIRARLG